MRLLIKSLFFLIHIQYSQVQEMMMEVKKQFQPSLDPISEILEENQLSITKPIIRDGSIRREVGFISSWKQRIFAILYVPGQKLTMSVYHKDSDQPQEIIDLAECKLSKKCSIVDQKIVFGLVTQEKRKYIISFKSSRDCLKYFYQIVSAKKLLKENQKKGFLYRSVQKMPTQNQSQEKELELNLERIETQTENQSVSSQQEEKVTRKMSEYLGKAEEYKPSPTYSAKSLPFKKESAPVKPEIKEIQKMLQTAKIEHHLDQVDKAAYMKLSNFEGFKIIEEFPHGQIYQNNKNQIKIKTSIFFDQSARSIVELFIHFDSWNNGVKQFTILNPVEKGVYRVETEFYKKGCFSKQKHCQSLISLYKVPEGFFLNMKALNHIPTSIKYDNWISFNLAVSIKDNPKLFKEKKMIISIEAKENDRALLQFAKDMKDFKNYLNTKVQLPSKLLEVRSTISD